MRILLERGPSSTKRARGTTRRSESETSTQTAALARTLQRPMFLPTPPALRQEIPRVTSCYPRVCQSTKKPSTDAGLFCARGGRRGEEPPENYACAETSLPKKQAGLRVTTSRSASLRNQQGTAGLHAPARKFSLSSRAIHSILKVARTVAGLHA
jgi:hypothetical protein